MPIKLIEVSMDEYSVQIVKIKVGEALRVFRFFAGQYVDPDVLLAYLQTSN